MRYVTGDSFDADDGCNTWSVVAYNYIHTQKLIYTCIIIHHTSILVLSFCSESGFVACTLAFCIDICDLPPDPGPCRAAIPAFHYDADTETCRQFIYGGCQGNPNKFSSVSDCLNRCNPESKECISPIYMYMYIIINNNLFYFLPITRCVSPEAGFE